MTMGSGNFSLRLKLAARARAIRAASVHALCENNPFSLHGTGVIYLIVYRLYIV